MRVGLYPGTFDPITLGHLDVVGRAIKLFDKLVIGVAINRDKGPAFSLEDRVAMVVKDTEQFLQYGEIEVRPMEGLLISFAEQVGASCIVRGLRAVSDFEYEFQMVGMNQKLNPQIETVFYMADAQHQAIASRLVKEIARLGGDVTPFQILALGCCGLALLVGPATFAQSSGPALRVVPMGEAPPAKKAPAKKAPTPAAKATATKPPATKAAVAARPTTTPTVSGAVKLAAKPIAAVSSSAATAVKPAASAAAAPAPATTTKVAFPAEDWRVLNPENALIYETTKGRIIVELAPEMAPGHVARVKMLARE
eukprot:gene13692-18369_t